jgi:hypothetical protein
MRGPGGTQKRTATWTGLRKSGGGKIPTKEDERLRETQILAAATKGRITPRSGDSRTRDMNSSTNIQKNDISIETQTILQPKHRGYCPPSLI